MKLVRPSVLPTLLVFLFAACAPTITSTPLLEPPATEPVQRPGFYPLETLTNIEEIDTILVAVANNDPQQVRDLFGYIQAACKTVNALGGPPPCRPGELEGTLVEVLPSLGPEGSFLRKDEVVNFPGLQVSGIHAIYAVSASAYSEEYYPAGDYAIAFVSDGGIPGVILQVRGSQIIRIDYIFDTVSFPMIFERDAASFILLPN